jgi:hypothetical protein
MGRTQNLEQQKIFYFFKLVASASNVFRIKDPKRLSHLTVNSGTSEQLSK